MLGDKMNFLKEEYKMDVIGFGALNLDKLYYVNRIAKNDEESFIKDKDVTCGGSAANTIIGLSKLNIKTSYIGKISEDEEGELLEMNLILEGVYLDNLIYSELGNSGKVLGFVDENGERALYVNPGVNDEISIDEINVDNVTNGKIIHYSSFVGNSFNAQNDLIDLLPDSIILSFDPGLLYARRGISKLKKIINRTNILLINEKELHVLFDDYYKEKQENIMEPLTFRDIAVYLLEDGIDNVVVKRGKKGSYAINNNQEVKIPAFDVDVIDTTGAGDSFNTGFLYSYLKGYSLEKSCLIGNWIASKSVENFGISGLPDLPQLEKFEKSLEKGI
jgi:ribokinase